MTEQQITLARALDLVSFHLIDGEWQVKDVQGHVTGNVKGGVGGNVNGVGGHVFGTINGKHWLYVESPKEKLARLIEEQGNEELLEAFNQAMRPTQGNNK